MPAAVPTPLEEVLVPVPATVDTLKLVKLRLRMRLLVLSPIKSAVPAAFSTRPRGLLKAATEPTPST